MAVQAEKQTSTQDSSNDMIRHLEPPTFSPLLQEKQGGKHDEAEVCSSKSTGADTITSRLAWARTPLSSTSPMELHRRCRDTIERCAAKLRERQRKMERLQLVVPSPKSKRTDRQFAASPPRSTPPRPAKRNKVGIAPVFFREGSTPGMRPHALSPSPISAVRSRTSLCGTPSTRYFSGMTASPSVSSKKRPQIKLYPKFSSPPPRQEPVGEKNDTQESTESIEDTLQSSPTDQSSHSSSNKAVILSPTWSRRQQSFQAAIEAEAQEDDSL